MEQSESIFTMMDKAASKAAKGVPKKKITNFVKKITVDLDQEHLDIIENYLRMEGVHSGLRGTIWEGLELLAEKYGVPKK